MTTTPSPSKDTALPPGTVQLNPSYRIPITLVAIALPLFLLQPWVSGVIAVFGLFLLYQTATLRLWFTDTALEIYRGDTLIRQFPYQDWLNWEIFWSSIPILFYFKEVNSIHFLPILFDPTTLKACLEQRLPLNSR